MLRISAIALSAGLLPALVAQGSLTTRAEQDGRKYKMLVAPLVLGKPGAAKRWSTTAKRSRTGASRYYQGPVSRFSQGRRLPC